jgi:hypothetical protein
MSLDKPFRVEVVVDAPRDAVWRALTEPEQIRHWFGWEYDGLEEEINVIFVEHATLVPPSLIELSDDGVIELEDLGERTLIRAIKPGDLDAAEWQDVYGDIEEGWITFFHQLRCSAAAVSGRTSTGSSHGQPRSAAAARAKATSRTRRAPLASTASAAKRSCCAASPTIAGETITASAVARTTRSVQPRRRRSSTSSTSPPRSSSRTW